MTRSTRAAAKSKSSLPAKSKPIHKKAKNTINPITYGGLTTTNTATKMEATLYSNKIKAGSKPQVYPKDWDAYKVFAESKAGDYIRGHLLNENLGGKGIAENLVPLTRHANAQHEINVESPIKKHLDTAKGSAVTSAEYEVTPIYSTTGDEHLKELKDELSAAKKAAADVEKKYTSWNNYIKQTIPNELECKWTLKNFNTTTKKWEGTPESYNVKNNF